MDEVWNVTKNVTTYYFFSPPLYPVKWADWPQDVPIYDPSRGANPKLAADGSQLSDEYFLSKERLDDILHISERFGPEILEQLTYNDENLGGHLPAPPLVSCYPRLQSGDVEITKYLNYPRLVRADSKVIVSPSRHLSEGNVVIAALAQLKEFEDEEIFKQKVVAFAGTYSPLNPYDFHADTLVGWRRAAETAAFWLEYFELHSRLRFARPKEYIPGLAEFVESHPANEAASLKKWLEELEDMRHDNTELTSTSFRAQVGEFLFRHFNAHLHSLNFAFSPYAFFVNCGSLAWMYREAWHLNGAATLVKKCQNPRCKEFFFPNRKNRAYCDDACKQAAYNTRKDSSFPSKGSLNFSV